jgi:hypothetical protein
VVGCLVVLIVDFPNLLHQIDFDAK